MCVRNLVVFGMSDIPITTIKLNAICNVETDGRTVMKEFGCWKCGGSVKEDKKHKIAYRQEITEIEKLKKQLVGRELTVFVNLNLHGRYFPENMLYQVEHLHRIL
jgi:hypothetical protein